MLLFLLFLAVFRGTRLVTRDKFPLIAMPREAFVTRWGSYEGTERQLHSETGRWWRWLLGMEFPAIKGGDAYTNLLLKSLAYLWECDWCTSVWVSALAVYTTHTYIADVPYPLITWLAASAVTGLLAQAEAVLEKKAE